MLQNHVAVKYAKLPLFRGFKQQECLLINYFTFN